MPSSAWLLPYDTFWNSDEILVTRPGRNYTVDDYQQLFQDIGFPDGYQMRKDTEKLSTVMLWFVFSTAKTGQTNWMIFNCSSTMLSNDTSLDYSSQA